MSAHFFEDTFKISSVVYNNKFTHTECEELFFHQCFCKGGCVDVEDRGCYYKLCEFAQLVQKITYISSAICVSIAWDPKVCVDDPKW